MIAIILALLVCGAFASPISRDDEARIVGGRPAGIGEFPYQTSLRDSRRGSHFCGGSIISGEWILTAAHCVRGLLPRDLVVVVGTNYLNSGGQSYYVAQITSHGAYNPQNNANDIALLRLSDLITASGPFVERIELSYFETTPGLNMVLSGWGLTSYPSTIAPNALQTINLQAISVAQCQQLLPGYPIFSTHICTYMVAGQGACKGDSGGPLVHHGVLYGVVSWGIPCAKGNPDIFTSVPAYLTWIKNVSGVASNYNY